MSSGQTTLARGAVLLFVYVVSALAGLQVASVGPMVSAIWPSTGVALAGLYAWGPGAVPWISFASLLVNLTVMGRASALDGQGLLMAGAVALTNTLGPIVAWRLLTRWGARIALARFSDLGWFYAAAAAGATVTACGGVVAMVTANVVPSSEALRAAVTWWVGDCLGFVVVAPALIELLSRRTGWGASVGPIAVCVIAAALFGLDLLGLSAWLDTSWFVLAPLVWLGVRMGPGDVALGFIAVATVFVAGAVSGYGPLVARSPTDPYLSIALWLGFGSVFAYASGVMTAGWREATREARRHATRLDRLLSELPIAAFEVDKDGLVSCNRAAQRMLGPTGRAPVGEWVARTFLDRRVVHQVLSHPMADDSTIVDLRAADGTTRRVRLSGAAAGGAQVWILEDITAREAHEAELNAAKEAAEEGMRAKTEFLATMSHEIRTPLNGVIGVAEVLRGTRLTAEQRQWLDTLSVSAESLLALLHDLLDFSRLEEGRWRVALQPVDPCVPAQEVVRIMTPGAAARGVNLSLSVGPDVPGLVRTDPACLRQILLNLVGNAVKFTETGSITVEIGWESGTLVVEVVDTGIGMGEVTLARVFEPFAQGERGSNRRYGGTGLGLAISKRLATMLDGSLTVRSEVGRGSRFTLRVPAEMARVSMREPRPTVRRPPIGLRVLVVEDNYVNQAVARAMLEDLGAVVGLASDGAAAVEVGLAQPWDIVLMDCQMPGMDGYEATRALRRAGFRSPILAMTAGAFESDRDAAFASGMDEWLVKPVVRDALAAALDHWCRRSAEGVVSDAVVEDVADGPMSA